MPTLPSFKFRSSSLGIHFISALYGKKQPISKESERNNNLDANGGIYSDSKREYKMNRINDKDETKLDDLVVSFDRDTKTKRGGVVDVVPFSTTSTSPVGTTGQTESAESSKTISSINSPVIDIGTNEQLLSSQDIYSDSDSGQEKYSLREDTLKLEIEDAMHTKDTNEFEDVVGIKEIEVSTASPSATSTVPPSFPLVLALAYPPKSTYAERVSKGKIG